MSRHMSYTIKDAIERRGYQIIAKNYAYLIKRNDILRHFYSKKLIQKRLTENRSPTSGLEKYGVSLSWNVKEILSGRGRFIATAGEVRTIHLSCPYEIV
jgi:hypothetical protein